MTNQELILKREALKNEYEVIKNKIAQLYDKLDKMDRDFIIINNEIEKRKI